MKMDRTGNASRNIIFGVILKLYQILIPFVMRTMMIYFMGVEYLGLNSLFTSVLQVLNLAELGVGSAMVYSMYKPIAEDDSETICALMLLYRKYYRAIGAIIGVVGVALTPMIPSLISGDIPEGINIYVLYLLHLSATVASYWLFAYKDSLLTAHQRVDIASKVTIVTTTLQYVLQFVALAITRNYYLYLIVSLGAQVINNIVKAIIATKMYPNYSPKGGMDSEVVAGINRRIKDLFTAKVGGVIINSADTLVISAVLGLTVLAIYQNYFFILSSVIGFVTVVFSACTAGIGNSIIVETKEKNYDDLNKFSFLIFWVSVFCCSCFLALYQPFMELWVGRELMLAYPAVIWFTVYFYINEQIQLLITYKDAAGIWHADRFRPLVTSVANLILNIIFVHFWGIYGVLMATVISRLAIGIPWIINNLFTTLFEREKMMDYAKRMISYAIVATALCAITTILCHLILSSPIVQLAIRSVIVCFVPNVLIVLIYRRTEEFQQSIILLDKMMKYKLHLSEWKILKGN